MKKLKFGVLSTAKIGREHVIPAIQKSQNCTVSAIASRSRERAGEVAKSLGINQSYGSYEELLADDVIDAVYIPLPNHLHVEWSIKALEAGKHVLCEKPIGLNADDARKLKRASQKIPHVKVMEAFMYRHHPRWKRLIEILRLGTIGEIKAVHSFFAYYNEDPENYRNKPEMGGGALMDVGCYSISAARLIFGSEPDVVKGHSHIDPGFKTDQLTSGLMSFGSGTSVFSCSTQSHADQYLKIYGTKGKIELERPFNPDESSQTSIKIVKGDKESEETFEACNQFSIQADNFAAYVWGKTEAPIPLDDSIANMEAIDLARG